MTAARIDIAPDLADGLVQVHAGDVDAALIVLNAIRDNLYRRPKAPKVLAVAGEGNPSRYAPRPAPPASSSSPESPDAFALFRR